MDFYGRKRVLFTINRRLMRLRQRYTHEEWVVLGLAASLFFPLYITLAALAAAAVYLLWRHRLSAVLAMVDRSAALLAFAGLGIVVPIVYGNHLGVALGLLLAVVALLSMAVRRIMTRRLAERIMDLACVGSLVCCAVAVAQQALSAGTPGYRAASVFYNPNYYAAIIEFVTVFCVYKLTGPAPRRRRCAYALTLAVNSLALYLSDCRTAWAAIALAVAVMLFIARRYKALAALAAATVLFVAALQVAPGLLPRLSGVDQSLHVRQNIWLTAMGGFATEPLFGRGAMAYATLWQKLGGPEAIHAHNLVLDLLLNYGVVGVALLALYLGGQVKTLLSRRLYRTDRRILVLMAGVFTAVLVHGMLDVTLFGVQTGLLFAIIVTVPAIYERKTYTLGAWAPSPADTVFMPNR